MDLVSLDRRLRLQNRARFGLRAFVVFVSGDDARLVSAVRFHETRANDGGGDDHGRGAVDVSGRVASRRDAVAGAPESNESVNRPFSFPP